jgi:hypothetical protein
MQIQVVSGLENEKWVGMETGRGLSIIMALSHANVTRSVDEERLLIIAPGEKERETEIKRERERGRREKYRLHGRERERLKKKENKKREREK